MKKTVAIAFLALLLCSLAAFEAHKFYMAVFQLTYASEKKRVQISSRIFVADLNWALEKKYGTKVALGTEQESANDQILLQKYLAENLTIKINGQPKTIAFLSKELDGDVLVCYCRIVGVSKLHSVEITNTVLTHWQSDQQNILHFTAFGEKKTLLFTSTNNTERLNF